MADRSLTPDEMGPHADVSVDDPSAASPPGSAPSPDQQPPAQRHRDPANATLAAGIGIVSTLIGLIVLAWTVLFITKGRFLKPTFEKYASRFSERQIRVAGDFQFYFAPFDIKFLAEGMTVSNPAWAPRPNFFESRLIDTRIKTLPLIFGKRRVEWLELDGAQVDAEWDAQNRRNTWTFGNPNAKGEPFQWPVIERAIVTNSSVRYRDPALQLLTDIKIDTVRAADTRVADNRVRFTGDGTMRGNRFTMYGALLSPNSTVTFGRTKLELHAQSGPTRLDVSGTLPAATQIEGADLQVTARGPNMRYLFDLITIAVPDTRSFRFTSKLTKAGDEWRFTRLTGGFGDSDLAGSMTISMPADRVKIVADLRSRKVDIIDVGPFVGYEPNALATKGVTAAAGPQTGGTPRLLPDAPLRAQSIKLFDAHVDYKVQTIRAPSLPVSNVALTLDLDRGLTKLSPMTMDVAGGHLSADVSIDARVPAVITDYDIRLSPTPMGRLLAGFGVGENGTTGTIKARVQMRGIGDTVRESLASSDGRIAVILPRGTVWMSYAQLSEFDIGVFAQRMFEKRLKDPVEINCGLIAFSVRNGVAAADPILIDTSKNVMTAKGGFSFKDESVNLAFRANGKKFSLLSGQSPVGIAGYFAEPKINVISPQLIARGAVGVGLIAAVNPIAGLLAFVDPGDAKSAACGPVLAGASATAQRTKDGDRREDIGTRTENRQKAATDDKKDKKFLGIF